MDFTPDLPAHDAPEVDFFIPDGPDRHAAVVWAGGIITEAKDHPRELIVRAAKTLAANSPQHLREAQWLLEVHSGEMDASHA